MAFSKISLFFNSVHSNRLFILVLNLFSYFFGNVSFVLTRRLFEPTTDHFFCSILQPCFCFAWTRIFNSFHSQLVTLWAYTQRRRNKGKMRQVRKNRKVEKRREKNKKRTRPDTRAKTVRRALLTLRPIPSSIRPIPSPIRPILSSI